MRFRRPPEPVEAPSAPPVVVSVSVEQLLVEAKEAEARLVATAERLLSVAVPHRDRYAERLSGHEAPEEHVEPEHVAVARLCGDCEHYASTPHPRLRWAVDGYEEARGRLLAFVSAEVDELDAWIAERRVELGAHPEHAAEIRAKLDLRDRYRRYRDQLRDGRGHEVPRLQVTHEGWAMTYYSANTEEWGALAETAPVELIPDEQVVHDMPTHIVEVRDELLEFSDALLARAEEIGVVTRRESQSPGGASNAAPMDARARLVRRG